MGAQSPRKIRSANLPFNSTREMKERQAAKIREIGDALRAAGYRSLGQQAKALGLPRSTAWTVLAAQHKGSGLSAEVVARMLAAPNLPDGPHQRLLEYIAEKVAGLYGHCGKQRLRFLDGLSGRLVQDEKERQQGRPDTFAYTPSCG
jgi:hypothetical protein